ncbi:hypothetical protein CO614_04845 [Lysobacteraceae bacterium NML120232]|nr:hypothetical protein CO608_08045 [Xanthomonadaceae bacterium NML08-0793]PJK12347.1 hypothetical protein CO614_04845 [Xanthomonadaceae bacterium NML120232]
MRQSGYRPGRSLKPFRHRWLWACLWMLAFVGVWVLSLLPPRELPQVSVGNDKLGHFIAYFALMAGAVQLYARRAAWMVMAILLALTGLGIEHLQVAMNVGRVGERADITANMLGIFAGFATGFTPLRDLLLRIDGGNRKLG